MIDVKAAHEALQSFEDYSNSLSVMLQEGLAKPPIEDMVGRLLVEVGAVASIVRHLLPDPELTPYLD
ncbi:hypothetical protein [Aeromicrobium sp. JJY06]|uniref:hypothetical protein n=1 Tax=Aeromicrobium sp. JJY06 TaxID=3373478 RepID=UPI00376EDB62